MDETPDDASFDAPWYEGAYPDVALSGLSAVDHYRIIGRRLGRPSAPPPARGPLADLVASAAIGADRETRAMTPDELQGLPIIDAPADLPPSRGNAADEGGRPPAPAGFVHAPAALWPILSLFARLHGRAAPGMFGLPAPAAEVAPGHVVAVGPMLRDGPGRISDLWYASTSTLCLRLDPAEGREEGSLHVYQADPIEGGSLLRVGGQRLSRRGPSFVEATLRNPLMPVLVELTDAAGAVRDLGLLAFPSLARGGLHGAELAGLVDGQTTTEALWAYTEGRLADLLEPTVGGRLARVLVSLRGAGGGEAIFSRVVTEWLGLFGLAVEPRPETAPGGWERIGAPRTERAANRPDGPALVLPPDGLPTVAALTDPALPDPGAERAVAVPHLVADRTSYRPRSMVTLPPQTDLGDLQSDVESVPLLWGHGRGGEAKAAVLPLAISYRDPRPMDPVRVLLPTTPEDEDAAAAQGGPVLCVLDVSEAGAARLALDALAAQQGPGATRLLLTGDAEAIAELRGLLPGGVQAMPGAPTVAELTAASGDAEALLFLGDRVVLQDPRTLARLWSLLARDRTASAACVVLHESERGKTMTLATESGGYFPSRVGFLGGPHLVFEQADTAQALPSATYPVAANALSATLVARAALGAVADRLPAGRPLDDLAFGLAALSLGWRHLCTSTVRAMSLRPRTRGERVDPVGLRRIAPARWEDLLAQVTLVTELR